jgi:hypothetical protein
MKRISLISIPISALVCLCLLYACKKPNEFPSHTATVSFPVITLVGPTDTTINRGATWKDPGATWKDTVTGESGTLTATAVNTSVDSAYLLIYTATNKNGFKSFVARGLGVTNYNGPINLSGAYTDNNGGTDVLYQGSRALFINPNADAFGAGDSSVIVIKSDSTISVATIGTYVTGTTGVSLPETFSQASIIYQSPYTYTGIPPRLTAQPPIIFSYTVTILNVPPVTATFYHN